MESLNNRPQKVLITRASNDSDHEQLRQEPGLMMFIPSVGDRLRMFLDNGKLVQTSPVTRVANDGNALIVDTRNSRYRLQRAA